MPITVEGNLNWGQFDPQFARAASRDVIDQVYCDHYKFETLFRGMRNKHADRAALLQQFSNLLMAHTDAEEKIFYPAVEKASDGKFQQKEEHDHTEGYVALLSLLEEPDVRSKMWDQKLTILFTGVMTHMDDEEQTLGSKALEFLTKETRETLGDAFAQAREENLAKNLGSIENVRKMVQERATMIDKLKGKVAEVLPSLHS